MMKSITALSALFLSTGLLAACDANTSLKPSMYEQSIYSQRSIELTEERFIRAYPAQQFGYDHLRMIEDYYAHDAAGPLYIAVGYDPDKKGADLGARNQANILRGQLAKLNLYNAVIKPVPVHGTAGEVVVGYDKLTARAPQNCGIMPGNHKTETGSYGDYGLGCTVMDMTAQQIAYPADLMGNGGIGDQYDGGQAATVVIRDVRAGAIREEIPSYILSEIGSDG